MRLGLTLTQLMKVNPNPANEVRVNPANEVRVNSSNEVRVNSSNEVRVNLISCHCVLSSSLLISL